MLARTYRTAAELGLQEHEYSALLEVLRRLDDGRIPLDRVVMETFHCGTAHCLAGWANVINKKAFPEASWVVRDIWAGPASLSERLPPSLVEVFGIASCMIDADGGEARDCLRHYLETGEYKNTNTRR